MPRSKNIGDIVAEDLAAQKKRKGRKPRAEADDFEWPEDFEEQREAVVAESRKAMMKQARIASKCLDEIDARDLEGEDLRSVASAAKMGTEGAKDAQKSLAELAPTRITPEFNFALATTEDTCPCCKRPWPEDLPRDLSGFDEPVAEA